MDIEYYLGSVYSLGITLARIFTNKYIFTCYDNFVLYKLYSS